ncbi:hypothetical protein BDQ12DRAFT_111665 [Crucibulum laeve]|uniref:Uncharacterized protein n=1 Tax=Crucibulum laeve TaxID=68775 RepID=A0A5C3MB87_9AGAR|nr:hypothetical protein BDQ12DRAFT_111665 [Crucibulum laeve]
MCRWLVVWGGMATMMKGTSTICTALDVLGGSGCWYWMRYLRAQDSGDDGGGGIARTRILSRSPFPQSFSLGLTQSKYPIQIRRTITKNNNEKERGMREAAAVWE